MDDQLRESYDEFLSSSNKNSYVHYYKYYRAYYLPQANIWVVLFVVLALLSLI